MLPSTSSSTPNPTTAPPSVTPGNERDAVTHSSAGATLRRCLRVGLLLLLVGGGLVLYVHESVRAAASGARFTVETAPAHRVGIVFGAAVFPDGEPGGHLHGRLEAALHLYQQGKVRKILVSGNNQEKHHGESDRMRTWLIERGVPPEDVQSDHAGFRTLDTCARAARVWNLTGEDAVILITQGYHLPRAMYLAEAWGLRAVGVEAAYPVVTRGTRMRDRVREFVARVLAWADVNLLDTQPRHFGPPEAI